MCNGHCTVRRGDATYQGYSWTCRWKVTLAISHNVWFRTKRAALRWCRTNGWTVIE